MWPWSTIAALRVDVQTARGERDVARSETARVQLHSASVRELLERRNDRLEVDVEGYKADIRRLTAQLVATSSRTGTLNPHFDPFAEKTNLPDEWLTGEDTDPNDMLDRAETSG